MLPASSWMTYWQYSSCVVSIVYHSWLTVCQCAFEIIWHVFFPTPGKQYLKSSGSSWTMQWGSCMGPPLKLWLVGHCSHGNLNASRALQVTAATCRQRQSPLFSHSSKDSVVQAQSWCLCLVFVRLFRCQGSRNGQQEHSGWWEITETHQRRYWDPQRAGSEGTGTSGYMWISCH